MAAPAPSPWAVPQARGLHPAFAKLCGEEQPKRSSGSEEAAAAG